MSAQTCAWLVLLWMRLAVSTAIISDPTYPYAGTVEDLADKLSGDAFERIGRTLQEWIESGSPR